jgi:hypothetical protein
MIEDWRLGEAYLTTSLRHGIKSLRDNVGLDAPYFPQRIQTSSTLGKLFEHPQNMIDVDAISGKEYCSTPKP